MPPPQIIESGPVNQDPNEETYIGEYQSILIDPFSNIHITWIDFSDGLKAKHTKLSAVVGTSEIEVDKTKINIYPNPAENEIIVQIHSVSPMRAYAYGIYDSKGVLVSSGNFDLTNENSRAIDIGNLTNGNYILEVLLEGGTAYAKFTKQL